MNGLCLRTQEGISNAVIVCPIETRSGRRCTSSPPKHSCVFGGAPSGCSPLPAEVRHAEAQLRLWWNWWMKWTTSPTFPKEMAAPRKCQQWITLRVPAH